MPRASTVRRTSPISALGLPFSTSTIHCRLTPTLAARDFWSRPSFVRRSRMTAPRSIGVRMRIGSLPNVSDRRHLPQKITLGQSRDLYRIYQQQIVNCDLEIEKMLRDFEPRTHTL